ncbi:hypothetical protein [Glycomyces tarimensis]
MTDNPKIAGLSAYLESTGWERRPVTWRGSTVWLHRDGMVASVPQQVMGDFDLRYQDAVEAIAKAEQRDVDDVAEALRRFRTDTQSFRMVPGDLPSGFIGLTSAVRSVDSIANIYRFAARAVVEGPNSEFKGHAPTEVVHLVREMRLGQPSAGSYVFNVHVPLPVVPRQAPLDGLPPEADGGLARQVLLQLHKSVKHTAAAQRAFRSDGVEVQATELIEHGVSAELCDEMAKLSLDEGASPFDIGFDWAYGLQADAPAGPVEFTEGAGSFLKALAGRVRRVKDGARARLTGEVVQLIHAGRDEPWLAKIRGELLLLSGPSGRSHGTTWVLLDERQYTAAQRANRSHLRVEAEGVFQLQRNRFELNVRRGRGSFSIIDW